METVDELLELQSGVISRRQLIARGKTATWIARKLRRREYVGIHEGVYLTHTGEPTWLQRAWAAVLFSWPAVLTHASALRAADGPGRRDSDDSVLHVAVRSSRHVKAPDGVRIHRLTEFDDRVAWNLSPPRIKYDHAVLDVAAAAGSDMAALGVLADAVQSRRTTAARLLATATERNRLPRRAWITSVLADVAAGTHSVLEHGYAHDVEAAHGLPAARRQLAESGVFRDAAYETGLLVELDGRLFHDNARARDQDLDRDLDAAVGGRRTVRLGWGQVFDRPCRTADRIGRLLQQGGWRGRIAPCGPGCTIAEEAA